MASHLAGCFMFGVNAGIIFFAGAGLIAIAGSIELTFTRVARQHRWHHHLAEIMQKWMLVIQSLG